MQGLSGALFSSSLKYFPEKSFLYFLLKTPTLKKFLIFSQKKSFSDISEMELSSLKIKKLPPTPDNFPEQKINPHCSHHVFYYCLEEEYAKRLK